MQAFFLGLHRNAFFNYGCFKPAQCKIFLSRRTSAWNRLKKYPENGFWDYGEKTLCPQNFFNNRVNWEGVEKLMSTLTNYALPKDWIKLAEFARHALLHQPDFRFNLAFQFNAPIYTFSYLPPSVWLRTNLSMCQKIQTYSKFLSMA